MKNEEIKQLSNEQIKEAIASNEDKLLKLRFAHAITPLQNPMQIKATRKEIARLHTELHARTLSIVSEKIQAGEITRYSAREFLSKQNNALPTPLNLDKIKRLISRFEK
jgi:large subunit ribosomal protein L29